MKIDYQLFYLLSPNRISSIFIILVMIIFDVFLYLIFYRIKNHLKVFVWLLHGLLIMFKMRGYVSKKLILIITRPTIVRFVKYKVLQYTLEIIA